MSADDATPAGQGYDESLLPFPDLGQMEEARVVEREGAVFLIGSESAGSGVRTFPAKPVCPVTGDRDMREFLFGPSGRLYSFSQIHVSANRPTPYTIGYVDFPEGVRVLAQVRGADPETLVCDCPVELRAEGADWFVVPTQAAI